VDRKMHCPKILPTGWPRPTILGFVLIAEFSERAIKKYVEA